MRVLLPMVVIVLGALVTGPLRAEESRPEPVTPPAETDEGETPVPVLEQATVNEVVRRGVRWLRKEQKRDGAFGVHPGETALCLLALRHSGVEADDRACLRAAARLERELPDGTVYGAAIGVVALLAQDRAAHDAKIRELVKELVAAQCNNGQWSYSYRRGRPEDAGDNSNSQFALLALGAARAKGIRVPKTAFASAREFLERTQNEDGGFGYSEKERSRSYSSMTAGALMSMSIARIAETDVDPQDVSLLEYDAIRRARGWLDANFDPAKNVGARRSFGTRAKRRTDDFWRHYHAWSIERAAAVTGLAEFGGRSWYVEGGRFLLERQHDDGRWNGPERDLVATCFALLFFRRSTERVVTPRERGPTTPSER